MRESKDELKKIVNGLFGGQADEIFDEIEAADELFQKSRPFEPTAEIIESVNANILAALKVKSRRQNQKRWLSVAAAAVIMLVAGLWMPIEKQAIQKPADLSAGIWADSNEESGFSIESELKDIESELIAIKLGEGYAVRYEELDEFEINYLEMELETDFWKG